MGPKTLLKKFFSKRKTKVPGHRFAWLNRRLHDPSLWHFGRRSVAGGMGLGLFLAFVPLPIQMLLVVPFALLLRVNLPVTFTAIWVSNPITFAPLFIFAFRIGTWITGYKSPTDTIPFEATFDGLAATLGDIWYPLLVGCLVCGLSAGAMGNVLVRWLWRLHLIYLRRKRKRISSQAQR